MNIKKAVIPVAGLGTRFLPATKTVPKEMLPIVDKPTLLYIMEEIVAADISHVVLIAGRAGPGTGTASIAGDALVLVSNCFASLGYVAGGRLQQLSLIHI